VNAYSSPSKMTVQVINQLESRSTFALNTDTGEQVFIGSRIAKMQDLREGDTVEVMVVPNDRNPAVAWYAIYARNLSEITPPKPKPETETGGSEFSEVVREFLNDGPASTRQVADHLGMEASAASSILTCMHRYGFIARCGVRRRGDQKSDSYVIWANDAAELLPEEEEHV